ncbi:YciI family protein [Salinicola sp. CR57]|uniref:YciI family protein n=1 Tax=Salinicola sp. CR57 TaxID=1949086 RepID=UPI000DA2647B|nr:YciI family protein [Salinicola sp. CR57]
MFIVSLSYKVSIDQVEAHLEGHIAWLKSAYQREILLASGRKVPRTGGVLLARGDRATLEACLAEDPFKIHDLAEYEIVEFEPSLTAPGLEGLRE